MSKAPTALTSLLHRLGVAGPVASRAFRGSGAPFIRSKPALFSLPVLVLASLAFTAVPALAALEAPEGEVVTAVTATTAHVSGVLNPKASSGVEGGFWGFQYGVSEPASCGAERLVPEPFGEAGIAAGLPKEEKSFELTGLQPHAKYTVCLLELNTAQTEQLEGVPVPFETKPAPPTIDSESVSNIKATEATLEGAVNPNNQLTECHFQYGTLGVTENTIPCSPELLKGFGEQGVAPATVTGLTPGTVYHYRIFTTNGKGEEAAGTEEQFTTAIAPQAPGAAEALALTTSTATFKGVLNPGAAAAEEGTYEFLYNASSTTCEGSSATPATATGGHKETVEAPVEGLLTGATYTVCLVAHNKAGETAVGPPETFTTLSAAPAVTKEEVTEQLGATTANVTADINANGLPTEYHAEYVTQAQFEAHEWAEATRFPVADAHLPAASTPTAVSVPLTGLTPVTAYRFRFAATNEHATAHGPSATFTTTTAAASASALPDNRGYELVSNSGGAGELYMPLYPLGEPDTGIITTGKLFRVARNGERIAYIGGPSASASSGNGSLAQGEGNQWFATRTTTGWGTQDISPPNATQAVYQGFASNLATAVLFGGIDCGDVYAAASGDLAPLFAAGVPEADGCRESSFGGTSEDGSQTIFTSSVALTPPAREGANQNLFESTAGHLSVVNVLEGGVVPDASFANENAISRDGTRIFWADNENGHLYVLKSGTGNVPVSGAGSASFLWATPDGHYAYYSEEGALRRFNTDTDTSEELAPATSGLKGLVGASEDGSYVYFVAEGALAPGARTRACVVGSASGHPPNEESDQEEEAGDVGCNLYESHEGHVSLVTVLSPADGRVDIATSDYGGSVWSAGAGARIAEVAPDGGTLVFESVRSDTGDPNELRGHRAIEVFVYSAADQHLACASCSPTGVAPQEEQPEATKLPAGGYGDSVSADGNQVFFESGAPLVSTDTNGVLDVYEWEREGAGSCPAKSPSRLNDGCIFLLTGGESGVPSFLVGADALGENVFFTHAGQLGTVKAPAGQNELYDARVNGGFTQNATACTGTGCQGVPPASPSYATPPSETFAGGAGNFTPVKPSPSKPPAKCKRGFTRNKHGKCVKKKKKKKATRSSAKRASNDRRPTR
jgi:hypothetical protein